jgi:hypothetical protein
MMLVLEILAILLTAVVMSLSLAHALELPGKMRLNREAYLTTQTIYYPGFTFGGIAEPLAVIVVFALLLSTSPVSTRFWLLLLSLLALAAVQIIFWFWVHPSTRSGLRKSTLVRRARHSLESKTGHRAMTIPKSRTGRRFVIDGSRGMSLVPCLRSSASFCSLSR